MEGSSSLCQVDANMGPIQNEIIVQVEQELDVEVSMHSALDWDFCI